MTTAEYDRLQMAILSTNGKRFQIAEGAEHACCNICNIIEIGRDDYLCECGSVEDALLIVNALNTAHP